MIGNYKFYKSVKEIKDIVHAVVTSPPYFQQRKYGDCDKEIGREKTVDEYCFSLVSIFNSIQLHKQGSIWVNIGDKRSNEGGLLNVPEQFALKMLQTGWLLIDKVIWAKIEDNEDGTTDGNCMTEPANYRLNSNGFEFLYRFSKVKTPWVDVCAVAIPRQEKNDNGVIRYLPPELMKVVTSIDGRNLHNVWREPFGQTSKKHYAVYPTTLCERPIAMTCPMKVCKHCGFLETRIYGKEVYDEGRNSKRIFGKYNSIDKKLAGRMDIGRSYVAKKRVTKGWTTCECMNPDWQPGIVLDPFMGSGTTGEVALKLGRSFIGVDIYDNYIDISKKRCEEAVNFMETKGLDPWKLRN